MIAQHTTPNPRAAHRIDPQAMLREATLYKSTLEHKPTGGVVIFYQGKDVAGWVNTLRNPESWQPGDIAIDNSANLWAAVGGDDYNGAQAWEPLSSTQNNNREHTA